MKLIFATHNEGKIKEMKNILAGFPWEILSAEEAGVTEEPVEDGANFLANALIKAKFVADKIHEWTVADDSGLCVEALNGAPGVFSARWAGENATGEEKADKVLCELVGLPPEKRSAYFETALVLVAPNGQQWSFRGKINGQIIEKRRGRADSHLPYDAIFIPEGWDKTFAEVPSKEKSAASHRGQAFRQLKGFLSAIK
jgi:XTP/dITP diphosphohydrolase